MPSRLVRRYFARPVFR